VAGSPAIRRTAVGDAGLDHRTKRGAVAQVPCPVGCARSGPRADL